MTTANSIAWPGGTLDGAGDYVVDAPKPFRQRISAEP
jgi:hypothetical protein